MNRNGMRRILSLPALLTLVAALMAACGSSQAHKPEDPKSAALQVSELPTPAASGEAGYWSPSVLSQEDNVPASLFRAHGLLRTYHNSFIRTEIDNMPVDGVVHADSTVTQWRATAGARWYFERLVAGLRHGAVVGTSTSGTNVGQAAYNYPYKPLSIPRIGNESAGFFSDWAGDEFTYTTRAVVFRQGLYVVKLRVVGHSHEVPVAKAITLARHIDTRLGG